METIDFETADELALCDWFIAKFEATKEEQWSVGLLTDPDTGAHCALGHCGVTSFDDFGETPEARALSRLMHPVVAPVLCDLYCPGYRPSRWEVVYEVNDRTLNGWMQGTPRRRILSALADVRAKITEAKP